MVKLTIMFSRAMMENIMPEKTLPMLRNQELKILPKDRVVAKNPSLSLRTILMVLLLTKVIIIMQAVEKPSGVVMLLNLFSGL
jgi:hypothetical protein